jgi:hypothetical protein
VRLRNDGFSRIEEVMARSIGVDGRVLEMPSSKVKAVPWREAPDAEDLRWVEFSIPEPSVGGMLEYQYEQLFFDPDFLPVWVFGGPYPILRAELSVVVDREVKVDFRWGRGEQISDDLPLRQTLEDGKERLTFVRHDIAPVFAEPDMPHPMRLTEWVVLVVSRYVSPSGAVRRLQAWSDVGDRISALMQGVVGASAVGSVASRFRSVRDEMNGIDVPGAGVRAPQSLLDLTNGSPACSRDASAVMVARLNDLRTGYFPVLWSSERGPMLIESLPGLYAVDRIMVAVDAADQVVNNPKCEAERFERDIVCDTPIDQFVLLDVTCRWCRFGETQGGGGRALVLRDKPEWLRVKTTPPYHHAIKTKYKGVLDASGEVSGALYAELYGGAARGLRDAADSGSVMQGDIARAIVVGDDIPMELDFDEIHSKVRVEDPVEIRAAVKARIEHRGFRKYLVRPSDLVGLSFGAGLRGSRKYTKLFPSTLWAESEAELELPVGYRVQGRKPSQLVTEWFEYAAGFSQSERVLRYSRRFVLTVDRIPAGRWSDFFNDLERVHAIERRPIDILLHQ